MPGRENVKLEKLKLVKDMASSINNSPVIGLIDLHKLPAAALQNIKWKLHGKVEIKVVRKRMLKLALEKSKKELLEYVTNQPAILYTKENPFKIYKLIQQNKSPVPAKTGDVAEDDIIISAGPTDLMPGPALTTLSSVKIKAKVEGGKITILKDATVCKAGEEISEQLASVLSMLKMKPMKIALNVPIMLEDGIIYGSDVLYIDDAETMDNLFSASTAAFNLAVEINYPTSETIKLLISKAFGEAKSLAISANIIESDVIDELLVKATREANVLEALVPETPKEKPKEVIGESSKNEQSDEKAEDSKSEKATDSEEEKKDDDSEKPEESKKEKMEEN